MPHASILLLDNRDSFVWNLAQAFMLLGRTVSVVRSDEISVAELEVRAPDAIVMSPGPGRPEEAGVCIAAVRALYHRVPMLGVCLGHQAVAAAFGGEVERGEPRHGKTSPVEHRGEGLFAELPQPLTACRYHSLHVTATNLPEPLEVHAWTSDGTIMGLRHRSHAVFGVQFHPESFRTPDGIALLSNFLTHASTASQ